MQNKCIHGIFFANKQESTFLYYQILDILRVIRNFFKFKICSLQPPKLYNNPSSVPSIFHNFLTPVETGHSYNTRNLTKLKFYGQNVRINMG